MLNYLNLLLSCMGSSSTEGTTESSGSSWWIIIVYIAIFGVFIYLVMIRPSKKQKKQQEETMNSLEPGDSVLTTSGFYGTVVAVTADTVIVEFGNNKNCRIPMAKTAIAQVEKANAPAPQEVPAEKPKRGRKKKTEEIVDNTTFEQMKAEEEAAEDMVSSEASSCSSDGDKDE